MRFIAFVIGFVATVFYLFALVVEQILGAVDHWLGLREKPKRPKELHRIGYGGEYINERGEIVRR